MSERLTDEEIARLFLIADTHSGGITMQRSNARSLLIELKERRASDVSKFDATVAVFGDDGGKVHRIFMTGRETEMLVEIRDFIQEQIGGGADTSGQHRLQLAVLTKLTNRGGQ